MLNMELVNKYFNKKGIEVNDKNRKFLLLSAGIAFEHKESSPLKCTYGGILAFSDKNYIYIPNNMIKIINKLNNGHGELHIIQGNLLSMIDRAEEKIKEILPEKYPIQAVVEAVKNAVLYREYFDLNKVIEIIIDVDDIIISSPGEFIGENIKGERTNYNKRNIWLYEKLISLDDKKRFLNSGRGFAIIKNSFNGKRKVRFINSRIEHSFKVILPGADSVKS